MDVIIISCVRSNCNKKIGFVSDAMIDCFSRCSAMYEFHSGSAYKVETFPRTISAYFALVIETFFDARLEDDS